MSIIAISANSSQWAKALKKEIQKDPETLRLIYTAMPEFINKKGTISKKAIEKSLLEEDIFTRKGGKLTNEARKELIQSIAEEGMSPDISLKKMAKFLIKDKKGAATQEKIQDYIKSKKPSEINIAEIIKSLPTKFDKLV